MFGRGLWFPVGCRRLVTCLIGCLVGICCSGLWVVGLYCWFVCGVLFCRLLFVAIWLLRCVVCVLLLNCCCGVLCLGWFCLCIFVGRGACVI